MITTPLQQLSRAAGSFAGGEKGYTKDSVISLNIRSKDEIGDLYRDIRSMEERIVDYTDHLTRITAEREHTETELHTAYGIQMSMLPSIFPDRSEYDLCASMAPAKEVGGDFYDFFLIDDTHLALVIADVSDKGVPAARVSQKMSLFLQSSLFARVLDLPVDFFRKNNTADIYGSLTLVEPLCTVLCTLFFQTGLAALLSLVYVFELQTAAPAMVVPALAVLLTQLTLQLLGVIGQMRKAMDRLLGQMATNGRALDTLRGVGEVKTACAESRALARFMEAYRLQADAEFHPPAFIRIQNALMPATTVFGLALLFWRALQTGLSDDLFIYFFSAYSMSSAAILQLSALGSQVASIRPILRLLEPILEEVPEVSSAGRDPGKLSGAISLNEVTFRYAKDVPPVLDRLELQVKPGEYLAVVGESGSGKSTLVRLLLGFEEPETGAVYYDGEDLRHLDTAAVRRQIGVVLQQGRIFSGNVFTNIAISRPNLTEEDAWAAAEAAGLADDIRAMPLGMQTILSDDAVAISGGQKQRLLIARVIAQKPSILILDEATSALDNVTQKKVTDALDNLNCTRIVIAHRLSTIRECDRIVLLSGGRIAEEGTYDELMALGGKFTSLVQYQVL